MSRSKAMKWFVISAALFTIVVSAVYLYLQKNYEQSFSVEKLQKERGNLVKQEMKFLSRGHNYAHYEVTAVGDRADTVVVPYRVPANSRKLKALLWVYDSPQDQDFGQLLDKNGKSQHATVLAYNTHGNFERDDRGNISPSRANVYNGLVQSKRGIDVLVQLLRKHQINDSSQVFVGGEDAAAVAVLESAAELPGRFAGVCFAGLGKELSSNEIWSKSVLVNPNAWGKSIKADRIGIIDDLKASSGSTGLPPFRKNPETMASNDPGIISFVNWAVGSDTVAGPVMPDTTFTKIVKVQS